jgi:hypothetical protein
MFDRIFGRTRRLAHTISMWTTVMESSNLKTIRTHQQSTDLYMISMSEKIGYDKALTGRFQHDP